MSETMKTEDQVKMSIVKNLCEDLIGQVGADDWIERYPERALLLMEAVGLLEDGLPTVE